MTQYKQCPRCKQAAEIQAPQCAGCGHQFRTQFAEPDATQMFGGPPTAPAWVCGHCHNQNPPHGAFCAYCGTARIPPAAPPTYAPPHVPNPPPPYGAHPSRRAGSDDIQMPPGQHSVAIAIVLSAACCAFGGQLYNRQFLKGVVLGLIAMVAAAITGGFSVLLTWPVLLADAACIASKLNRGEPVRQWEFF